MTEDAKEAKTDDEVINDAMMAVLRGEDGETPPVEPKEETKQDAETEEPTQETPEADVPPVVSEEQKEAPKPKYTEDDVVNAFATIAKLQKALDTVNGTYGNRLAEIQARINELQSKQQSATTMSSAKLEKLRAEYPDVADLLEADMQAILVKSDAPQIDQAAIDKLLEEKAAKLEQRLTEKEKQMEIRELKRVHPDFREVAGYDVDTNGIVEWINPEFGVWAATTLTKEERSELINSNDAGFLSEVLTRYKESKKTPSTEEPKQTSALKQKTIENALRPKSVVSTSSGVGKSEEEIMREAMLKAMNE